MQYLRSLKGCKILNKIRNEDFRRELEFFNFYEKIDEYHKMERPYPANAIHEIAFTVELKSKRDCSRLFKALFIVINFNGI